MSQLLGQTIINVSEDHDKSPSRRHRHLDVSAEFEQQRRHVGVSPKHTPKPKPAETVLEWFDRSMEEELKKRRYDGSPEMDLPVGTGLSHPLMVESVASGIDIQSGLRGGPDTELLDAVDKLAKAEAIVAFEGAVKAAEKAASEAPPELAEEAALAGARGYQAELTSVVREKLKAANSIRPIEVIGYVGITRPKFAKAPKHDSHSNHDQSNHEHTQHEQTQHTSHHDRSQHEETQHDNTM